VRHDIHRASSRFRPTWLVLTLAALLAVPLLAAPVGAAPPATSITDVTITGTLDGTGDCLWRMEVTVENFRGGGKTFTPNLGSPHGSRILYSPAPTIDVKGKATYLVWEHRESLTDFPAVANWAVNVANNKGQKDFMSRVLPAEDIIVCK
jgi:hypothetical protein